MKRVTALVILAAIIVTLAACGGGVTAENLTDGVEATPVNKTSYDYWDFYAGAAGFSLDLFRECRREQGGNTLISPISVLTAMAMAGTGAAGNTRYEMSDVFGLTLDDYALQTALHDYISDLTSSDDAKFTSANSVWVRDDFKVLDSYLGDVRSYFGAEVFSAAFDDGTVKDMNNWVKHKTDKMIDQIINDLSDNDKMVLLNAVCFDAEWLIIYEETDMYDGEFTDINGDKKNAEFMRSNEWRYIEAGGAAGFIKSYKDGYSFAAILPGEGVELDAYIDSLTGDGFLYMIRNAEYCDVKAHLPKFSFDYDISLSDALQSLGIVDAFTDDADFSGMTGKTDLFIGDVLHKAHIDVDGKGTRAGAASAVIMAGKAAPGEPEEPKVVKLDRPFVFAIVDDIANLPLFIGAVETV
ncbi:MAG: serpin family protein [Oscillospiraceae bacterium]|nr:serpin family protein [Oscillospiraceae bacterium]